VFNVTAATAIGETVCVSGNHPLLGSWEERNAIELVTTPEYYPTWYSLEPVNLPLGETVAYKYFIKSGGQFSRWESEEGDRSLTLRGRDLVVDEEISTSATGEEVKKEADISSQQARQSTTRANKAASAPVAPPMSPARSSPILSSGSPKTNHSGSDTSDFEELQLDGRDAVIIASVFLPVRVRRVVLSTTDSGGISSGVSSSSSSDPSASTTSTTTSSSSSSTGEPALPWHIEWDDSALLSRHALFSRKLQVD
jgi:hypothetical protein